ncbi:restriction endonuclease subunit S [Streptomyces sp. rh34]|uniref:restriction endonuclease subunit S n=1 Tax=Streptomyces sp. rh34 TaxID=2034272 RepID=UPI0015CF5664|nr:restriction endonuclease subunit S [Streptomyces sp. rh34]
MNTAQHLGVAAAVAQDHPNLYLPDRLWAVTFCGADARFIDWWTKTLAYRTQVEAVCVGTSSSMQNISQSDFLDLRIDLPEPGMQGAIADYLDRETASIDTLIGEQQSLIGLLRERRQAIIDAAFSVLGEPSVQLRRYTRFLTSGSRGWGDYYADEGERFVRIGNLPRINLDLRGEVQFVDIPVDAAEGSRTMLQGGDLLFSITAYLGSVAVVEGEWVGAYVSQHVALCRLESEHVDSRFIGWFMLTTTGQGQLSQGAAGGAKIQLALDDIRELRVPLAPINEQRSIASSLDERTAKIDVLIAESERFIELARERRSALITEAVTGQIDVREAA